jgi:hypothetical protein
VSYGNAITMRLNRIALALPWIIFGIASCAEPIPSTHLYVEPSSIDVAAGSSTSFAVVLKRSLVEEGGSLTWSVAPANGGTITSEGVYTASGTAGHYMIVATWTPVKLALGEIFSGSATVEVLPGPQLDSELNPNVVQASGAIQMGGAIQNAAISGQLIPSLVSTDPNGNVQVRGGFTPPVACVGSNSICY